MSYSIADLNQMNQAAFIVALGAVFEDTPTIAERTWYDRPFTDVSDLHQKMVAQVRALPFSEQLALIQAHPDLGSKAKMADASVQEQAGLGLDRLTESEFDQFQTLNRQYRDRFNFPFIVAVRHHTKATILQAFMYRLENSPEIEVAQAVTEIAEIARFRLLDLIL
jgi:2-oxo-4-hydroxy-4-carboxy-5-ureidoimidazoline decarboxylase